MAAATARIDALPVPLRTVWNPETCPESLLPWLAWALSVDEWNKAWSAAQKRETIKRSFIIHRHKGTVGAVREALAALGMQASLVEWFNMQPEGDPYTFRVLAEVGQVGIGMGDMQRVMDVVNWAKNLRSHNEGVDIAIPTTSGPYLAAVSLLGLDITLPYQPPPLGGGPNTAILGNDFASIVITLAEPITGGDPLEGVSRTAGPIISASVVDGSLVLVIPLAYDGDVIGSVEYDNTIGDLITASGPVPAFVYGPVVNTSSVPPPAEVNLLSVALGDDDASLVLTFDQPLAGGAPLLGVSRTLGSITSGSIVDGSLVLVIPRVFAGDELGAVSYDDSVGTLAGEYGFVTAFLSEEIVNTADPWTPQVLASIVDYGDASNAALFSSIPGGGGPPVTPGAPVTRWGGHKGQLTFRNDVPTGNPIFTGAGVQFIPTPQNAFWSVLFAPVTGMGFGSPFTLSLASDTNLVRGMQFYFAAAALSQASPKTNGILHHTHISPRSRTVKVRDEGFVAYDETYFQLKNAVTLRSDGAGQIALFTGDGLMRTFSGSGTTAGAAGYLEMLCDSTSYPATTHAWAFASVALSDEDCVRLTDWANSKLPP